MLLDLKFNTYMIFYLLPIIICLATFTFWFLGIKYEAIAYYTSTFSIALNAIIIPIYLVVCSFFINDISISKKIIYSFSSNMISIIIQYCNWGLTTKLLFSPDAETKHIVYLQIIVSCAILAIYFTLHFIFKIFKSKIV